MTFPSSDLPVKAFVSDSLDFENDALHLKATSRSALLRFGRADNCCSLCNKNTLPCHGSPFILRVWTWTQVSLICRCASDGDDEMIHRSMKKFVDEVYYLSRSVRSAWDRQ